MKLTNRNLILHLVSAGLRTERDYIDDGERTKILRQVKNSDSYVVEVEKFIDNVTIHLIPQFKNLDDYTLDLDPLTYEQLTREYAQ
ncbi:hypothetical protein [Lactococcus petauri]|uniref:Uncharacterized protein n=1 Tax=Lactococcus phage WP-2 TaxID=1486423 RepID=A0A024B3S7_9CAUD|nr:hypothetical protein [Lactococcus petauri]YP_009032586.1 hypothetical protein WP2_09 [Lactococcus phage WP-2]AHZ10881.1 hypothetical protein WP2_09 [Lactococcus phage WP-2]MCQ8276815.1 hypothetical protein [Lactococcus petauri]MCR6590487.1 hypothetical protein [Lactococcus petauri]